MLKVIGIDLAKQVFQVHGIDEHGHAVLSKRLQREQMARFFANLTPCLIGMEACSSAHHWARKLLSYGHTVKLMAPQFVRPYVKGNKNDVTDASAICEAVTRPRMTFVAIKTVEQQTVLTMHRIRQGLVKTRTAQANQIRGLLAEFGLVVAKGISTLTQQVPDLLEDASNDLPMPLRHLLMQQLDSLHELNQQIEALEAQIEAWHQANEASRRLAEIPGIGALTASALIATIGDVRSFANGRQLAAWIGLVPRQHSSGGKPTLLGINKRGDRYLRTLLIHGARSVLYRIQGKTGALADWLNGLLGRRHPNVAVVALANRNARIVWGLLTHGDQFRPGYTPATAGVSPARIEQTPTLLNELPAVARALKHGGKTGRTRIGERCGIASALSA